MRYAKALMILFLAVTLVGTIVFTSNDAMAKVGDNVEAVCSVCHTMHHSQDGTDPTNPNDETQSVGPNNALLYGDSSGNNATCVACHTGSGGTHATLGYDEETGAPIVDLAADKQLAGGTYVAGTDKTRHNALGITGADATIPNDGVSGGDIPPGGANSDIGDALQITCAGTTGCHGDRAESDNVKSVHGAHHLDDRTIDGTKIGKSYRFLGIDVSGSSFSSGDGVDGLEHDHWESGQENSLFANNTLNADDHNVYDAEGINRVCASCHGDFHGTDQGTSEPWIRHPTDITLESAADEGPSAEYDEYPNTAGGELYSTEAPVGFTVAQADGEANVDANDGQVLCISCHRAHGSEWDDILRWNYDAMLATGGEGSVNTGCNRCHTTK